MYDFGDQEKTCALKEKETKEKCPLFSLDLITQLNVITAFSHPLLESDSLTSRQAHF